MVQKRDLYRYSVDSFLELLGKVTKRKVNYKCNNADSSAWNNFIKEFGDGIGEEFVRNFIEFGINSWFGEKTEKDFSRCARYSWVFGKRAISRWRKNTIEINNFISRKGIKKTHRISLKKNKTKITELINTVREVEERFKSDYHNTRRGFLWCVSNTTLYHHKSAQCATCDLKNECKEILKNEYPTIYVKRGYGKK